MAHREPVESRVGYLRSLATNRSVLDIGVVEHDASNEQSGRWLHRQISEVAATCLGVDVLCGQVEVLRDRGYNVICRDVMAEPLDQQFDVIIAGELIEHLGSPGSLFDAAAGMLEPHGRLVLTTPNPYMLHRVWKRLRGRFQDSVDHAVLLDAGNLAELAGRSGLQLESWRGILLKDLPGWRNKVASAARALMRATVFADEIACDSIIYEFVLTPPVDL